MTFDYDSLFDKSRLLIEKSIAARNANQSDDCQLWAAFAQEILAKAALARIHPALVADPGCSDSLFAACGRSTDNRKRLRSIPAKKTYDRIRTLFQEFDSEKVKFCEEMANSRNAQLHSGETPYADEDLKWVPKYWSACIVLLELQGKSLTDWIDDNEAVGIEEVVNKKMTALQHLVEARIEAKRQEFQRRYPEGSKQRKALQQQRETVLQQQEREAALQRPRSVDIPWPYSINVASDITVPEECPACRFQGGLACKRRHDGPVTVEPFERTLIVLYEALEFQCEICGLRLNGREELKIAEVKPEIEADVYSVGHERTNRWTASSDK